MNYFFSLPFAPDTKMVKLPCVIAGCTNIPDTDISLLGDAVVVKMLEMHERTFHPKEEVRPAPAKIEKLDTSRLPKVQLGAGEMTTHKWKVWKCGFEVWKEESGFGADKDMG